LPVYKVPFYLQANETHNLWFPGIQTGPHGKRMSSAPSAALTFSTPLTEDSRGVVVVT
jgi:hypothetical protein